MQSQHSSAVAQMHRFQPTDLQLVWGRRQDRDDKRFRARAAIVEHLIARWTNPEWNGVDVSGGAGRWLRTLAPHFGQFTHLDLSPNALNVARSDHTELANVEFELVDLLHPREPGNELFGRTWDVAFCLDTLLYRGDFVEIALRNIRRFIRPGGIAIIDVPMQFRASISRRVKGKHYGGPERTFSPQFVQHLSVMRATSALRCRINIANCPS